MIPINSANTFKQHPHQQENIILNSQAMRNNFMKPASLP
jgi:hypothetical protein